MRGRLDHHLSHRGVEISIGHATPARCRGIIYIYQFRCIGRDWIFTCQIYLYNIPCDMYRGYVSKFMINVYFIIYTSYICNIAFRRDPFSDYAGKRRNMCFFIFYRRRGVFGVCSNHSTIRPTAMFNFYAMYLT